MSCFVGNMDFNMDQHSVMDMFRNEGMQPVSVRIMKDDQGRSKGAAFIDFSSATDAATACSYDGRQLGGCKRPLRINKA